MADFDDLFGLQYQRGGRFGKDQGIDCYGLVIEAYRRYHKKQIPDIATPDSAALICAVVAEKAASEWKEVSPKTGSVVLMRLGKCMHVGLQIDDSSFIHIIEGGNVCVEKIKTWEKRIVGFYTYIH